MKSSLFRKTRKMNVKKLWIEISVRLFLIVLFVYMEKLQPFQRKIHPEEIWLYKNPMTPSYVPSQLLWPIVVFTPLAAIAAGFFFQKSGADLLEALLSFTLALGLNGVVTDIGKLVVGRPRPDFFWRCFPNGDYNPDMQCTGDPAIINEGRKSFPSGHSSFSFASLGFISLYAAGKLGVFNAKGRGQSVRLLIALSPLLIALAVALSRTADYHHHWQDVLCGSLLGLLIAYVCYRQHYPPLDAANADISLVQSTSANLEPSSANEIPYKLV